MEHRERERSAGLRHLFPASATRDSSSSTNRISEAASFAFLQLGVKGFVTQKHLDELPRAVVSVVSGGLWIPRTVLSKFLAYTLASARAPERARGSVDRASVSGSDKCWTA